MSSSEESRRAVLVFNLHHRALLISRQVDPYNTQSAIALLRQHMEYEHMYDLAKLSLKNIANTQV